MAITEAGDLVAWVSGSTTYATKVSLDKGALASVCTCPYYGACKHAVAVILEYLGCIENGKNVSQADKKDERLLLVEGVSEYPDDDDDLYDDHENSHENTPNQAKRSARFDVDDYLGKKSKKELLNLINGIISRNPEIREELNYKAQTAHGKPSALVKTVEREILKTSSEMGWRNYWKHTGHTPDYSRVRSGLQRLLDSGYADEVVRLGEKLFSRGIKQVEQSNDEGETAEEVANALEIVFEALGKCSLADSGKMEKAVDFALRDEYGLCHGLEVFWKRKFGKKDWDELANRLLGRLSVTKDESSEDSFSRDYRRDRLTDEIIRALECAGRNAEMIDLCTKEAEITGSYVRLVKQLRKSRRVNEAESWIRKGISATLSKLPGIASALKNELLEIRRRNKDWLYVAAVRADEFFENPGIEAFEELKSASEKAEAWLPVREALLHFLESGKCPRRGDEWPLPDTGLEKSGRSRKLSPPIIDVLINIAIYEKRVDDVLQWYEAGFKKQREWLGERREDNVATAIADLYPEKAVEIWKGIAESHISQTNVGEYLIGANYLRKVRKTLIKNGKTSEWDTYVARLREANRRRPRLIEILDGLSEKPIIKGWHQN
ncbi:MAG: SWIM zinc finger family protein [Nitrospirae bacterium]|nr:SWIM zinc finger family protein [Nitrospirota bacterium]